MTILRKGDHGIQVRKLQLLLNSSLVPPPHLKVDGVLGARTEEAVRSFQASKGLSVDGVVGSRTLLALGLKDTLAPTMSVISPLAPWLDIAVAELGVHEDSLPGRHNARILEYHQCTTLKATTDETPWCSSFVNWVLAKAGKRGTNDAMAKSWLAWGAEVVNPTPGVITIISRKAPGDDRATGSDSGYHVGFFVSLTSAHVRLLGGNQQDQVKYSNFSLSSYHIEGYRRPL
jgi:uncharacterized protein (TIGR02594 family)